MSNYFRRRYKRFNGDISVKVDLSNYATKTDLQNVSYVDVSSFALKSNLASMDNTNFVSKTKYEKYGSDFEDKSNKIEKKIPKISSLVKKKNRF